MAIVGEIELNRRYRKRLTRKSLALQLQIPFDVGFLSGCSNTKAA
jgi:hypothetical protein